MWYLIEDFFEQSLVMKLFLAWGWVSVWIMVASFITTVYPILLPEAAAVVAPAAAASG